MNDKKAVSTALAFLGSVILVLLFFFVFFAFMVNTGSSIVTEVEEQACKAYLQTKSTSFVKKANFFFNLQNSCKTGELESDAQEKEDVFREIAERSSSCWNRYGSGELDFMSNYDTTGEYCFPCTQITYEEDFEYDYSQYVEWIQENGPENSEKTYSQLINIQYFNDSGDFQDVEQALSNLREEIKQYQIDSGDTTLLDLYLHLGDYSRELLYLKNKKISSNQQYYVVFKYNRVNNSLYQSAVSTLENAGKGAAGSIAVGAGIRLLVSGPVGAVVSMVRIADKASELSKVSRIANSVRELATVFSKYKKTTLFTAAGTTAGGVVGSDLNFNSNQHIDIISERDYMRVCGVKPVVE